MGASGWDYTVPYDPETQSALDRLRQVTFESGEYLWDGVWGSAADGRRPRPGSLDELLDDEAVRYGGTHSIIDCPRVGEQAPTTEADWAQSYGVIYPVPREELLAAIGTDRPTSEYLPFMHERVGCARWTGRWTVVYTQDGSPYRLAFWGSSGD